ncbi:structural maintenance of chromosomes protein 2 [Physcia stellaris]|nr:structural maintenance of chromosomes protein 2 [Physcia stellaris]
MKQLTIDPGTALSPIRHRSQPAGSLPDAKETKLHPRNAGGENASLLFIGTATTILDHFDQEVEASLRRDLPIITTPHAKSHLADSKIHGEAFTAVHDLGFFQDMLVNIIAEGQKRPAIKVTGMPGKHVAPGVVGTLNDLINAVPPTNGWMIELGYKVSDSDDSFQCGYRYAGFPRSMTVPEGLLKGFASIYISGDTLMVPELAEIPRRYSGRDIDLMLVHLGGTTIPSPNVPLLMVTMDAEMGIQLIKLINPDVTIPIHFDDYDVFLSSLDDFKKAVKEAGLEDKVVYLDRKDAYHFEVQGGE